jgi:trk system potassium uptake protein
MRRVNQFFLARYTSIAYHLSIILICGASLLLAPLLVIPFFSKEWIYADNFILPSIGLAIIAIILRSLKGKKAIQALDFDESGIVITLGWILVSVFAAFPLMSICRMNFTQAVFESVSGWTTTGLSVVNFTNTPQIIYMWRAIMQLAGGAGLAIIMIAALTGVNGTGLYSAEGKGLQMKPHVKDSARIVMALYSGYAIIGTIAYIIAGMTVFDAIIHCFAAISTGGFSNYADSIGHWNTIPIEIVSIVLMILGNINFVTAYLLVHGKWKAVLKNGEIKVMLVLIPLCSFLVFMTTTSLIYPTLTKQIRVAIFEVVTALTTTGFSTVSYVHWTEPGVFILILLMLVGGGTCSTAGGIKQIRVYLLYKSVLWQIKRALFPANAIRENHIWDAEQKEYINDERMKLVGNFTALYLFLFFIGAFILMSYGYSIRDSLFEFASSIGTVGISLGVTSLTTPKVPMWAMTAGMLLGRLEFFVIFSGILKIIRDLYRLVR